MVTGLAVAPSLVGRSEELEHLAQRRAAAARGRGGVVVVTGESGVGKSRLIRGFRETLRGGRARFGIGLCAEIGTVPYAPLLAALRAAGCFISADAATSQPEFIAGMLRALEDASMRNNLVIVIEDVHWADEGTLAALAQMAPSLARMRVLAVLTYRPGDIDDTSAAAGMIARLERTAARIHLEPLSREDMRALLRSALGPRSMNAQELDRIVVRAEGNPFFAEEMLKNAMERRAGDERRDTLPLTIRAAVLERLARLDASTQIIAQHAAILGRSFDATLLARVCGVDEGTALAAVRSLRDCQIVSEDERQPNVFAFRHALTREVIYHRLLAAELASVHKRVLVLLEDTTGPALDLGYHAFMARDAERCRHFNEAAGDQAESVHAYADAVACYERAIAFETSSDTRARVYGKAASAAAKAGRATDAFHLYERAVESALQSGNFDFARELQGAMGVQARLAGSSARAETILTRALAGLTEQSETFHRLALSLAFCKCDKSDIEAAHKLVSACSAAQNTEGYWSAMRYLASIKGDVEGVRAAANRSMELAREAGTLARLRARFNFGFTLCALGYDEEAHEILDALLPQLRDANYFSLEVLTLANLALMHARAGHPEAARTLVNRGLAVPEPQTTGPVALAAAALTVALALDDDELVARAVAPSVIETAQRCGIDSTLGRIAGPYARWLYRDGQADRAREVLSVALRVLSGPFGATETIVACAELFDHYPPELARLLEHLDSSSSVPLYESTAAHVRALMASDAQVAHFNARRAADIYEKIGWRTHAAECSELASSRAGLAPARVRENQNSRLSVREAEIAQLIASGASNRALAESLSVSQRTVEKHLTSIYGKLGLRNRSQLAALMSKGDGLQI